MSAGNPPYPSTSSPAAAAFRSPTPSSTHQTSFPMNPSRHHHHPHHPHHHPHHAHGGGGSSSSAAGSSSADVFTPEMRDRQARGKDPYRSGDASDASDVSTTRDSRTGSKMRLGGGEKDDFGKIERREKAVAFLDNPELLMMYAQSTGDSIPSARLHFMKMMCGYDDEFLEEDSHARGHAHAHNSHGRRPPSRPARDTDKRRGGDRAAGR